MRNRYNREEGERVETEEGKTEEGGWNCKGDESVLVQDEGGGVRTNPR